MKKRYSEEQIIGFLKEAESGVKLKDLCRRHGFSEGSYYLWRSKYGGMDVSDAKSLKTLGAENARRRRLPANPMRESEVSTEALRRMYDPSRVSERLLLMVWLVGLPKCIGLTEWRSMTTVLVDHARSVWA